MNKESELSEKDIQLLCFQAINNCETFEEMKAAITAIGNANKGIIKGKTKDYPTHKLLTNLEFVRTEYVKNKPTGIATFYNVLTREYGIRQQAIYLHNYGEI